RLDLDRADRESAVGGEPAQHARAEEDPQFSRTWQPTRDDADQQSAEDVHSERRNGKAPGIRKDERESEPRRGTERPAENHEKQSAKAHVGNSSPVGEEP